MEFCFPGKTIDLWLCLLAVNIANSYCQLADHLFLMNSGLIFSYCGLYFCFSLLWYKLCACVNRKWASFSFSWNCFLSTQKHRQWLDTLFLLPLWPWTHFEHLLCAHCGMQNFVEVKECSWYRKIQRRRISEILLIPQSGSIIKRQ